MNRCDSPFSVLGTDYTVSTEEVVFLDCTPSPCTDIQITFDGIVDNILEQTETISVAFGSLAELPFVGYDSINFGGLLDGTLLDSDGNHHSHS